MKLVSSIIKICIGRLVQFFLYIRSVIYVNICYEKDLLRLEDIKV